MWSRTLSSQCRTRVATSYLPNPNNVSAVACLRFRSFHKFQTCRFKSSQQENGGHKKEKRRFADGGSSWSYFKYAGTIPIVLTVLNTSVFAAGSDTSSSGNSEMAQQLERIFGALPPELRQYITPETLPALTFGGVAGFASGYALKKVGKIVIIACGCVFMLAQLGASTGFVKIDWVKVAETFEKLTDEGKKAGEGKAKALQLEDVDGVLGNLNKVTEVLTRHMGQSAAGFTGGFLLGLKRG